MCQIMENTKHGARIAQRFQPSPIQTSTRQNNPLSKNMLLEGKSVFDCSLCEMNKMHDDEGNLTFIYENVHVPPGIWASEQGFSSGSICLVLVSHDYSEDDYIRNYEDYLEYIKTR